MILIDEADEHTQFLEKEPFTGGSHASDRRKQRLWKFFTISLIFVVTAQTGLMIFWTSFKPMKHSYGEGFDTDLAFFKSSIQLVKTRFSSALHTHKNGTFFLQQDPEVPKYVGFNKVEVNQNWDKLLAGRYYWFSGAESKRLDSYGKHAGVQASDETTSGLESLGTFGGVDMFHSLHCLNALRLAVDGAANEQHTEEFTKIHIDHCIEQLRQAILCHGDLTPVTLTTVSGSGKYGVTLLGQTEYPHTCRDWNSFREKLNTRAMTAF